MSRDRRAGRHGIPLLFALVAASLAVIWALVLTGSFTERANALKKAGDDVSRMGQLVAEQTGSLLSEIKVYLLLMDTWLRDNPGSDPRTDPRFLHLVDNLREHARFRVDLRLVSENDGLFYVPSKDTKTPLAMVGDREFVQAQKDPARRGFYIAGPVLSRVTGIWGIPVSYPLSSRNAGLSIVFAAIELPYLEELYESVRPKPDGSINLVRNDGVILCRAPFDEKVMGRNLAADGSWPLAAEGVQLRTSPIDGKRKVSMVLPIPDMKATVVVSMALDGVLASWRTAMLWRVLLMTGLTAVILVLGVNIWRNWRLLESSNANVAALNGELRLRIEEVRRQLEEKAILVKETNHRVKNHMAQLISLIGLTEDSGEGKVVESLRARIYGFSLLYEKLSYQADDAGQLDLSGYVEDLLRQLVETAASERPVRWSADVESIPVPARTCSTLGLVISELVTNSIKHAKCGNEDLSLSVFIRRPDDGRIRLSYSDNGEGFDFERTRASSLSGGLGMVLIDSMIEQYGGSISYSRDAGSRFGITL